MICPRCLLRGVATASFYSPAAIPIHLLAARTSTSLSLLPQQTSLRRLLTTTAATASPASNTAGAEQHPTDAASTKKSVRATPGTAPISISSVPAGTPLRGLNFVKGQNDPVAMEDHEYPAWLWDVLKKEEVKGDDGAEGDLFAKSKKQRRIAAKKLRKQQQLNPELLVPKVPLYEQSVDLAAGDGSVQGSIEAENVRQGLTKAMRAKRRGQIKEDNFLREMR